MKTLEQAKEAYQKSLSTAIPIHQEYQWLMNKVRQAVNERAPSAVFTYKANPETVRLLIENGFTVDMDTDTGHITSISGWGKNPVKVETKTEAEPPKKTRGRKPKAQ